MGDRLTALRSRVAPARPWLWFSLFALLVSWSYSDPQYVRSHAAVPEAHGDGFYYYAYLRSLAFDRDVDFTNDYRLLPDQFHAGINRITKRPQNVFTVGPALFWMPMVPVALAAEHVGQWFGAPPDDRLDGTEYQFQRVVLYGSVLAGLIATAIGLLLALRLTEPTLAAFSSIGLCIGSPLIWFMLRQPSFSHATDACAVALFVGFWFATFGSTRPGRWTAVGALLGIAMLVRPQNVAHGVLPLVEWCIAGVPLWRQKDRAGIKRWLLDALLLSWATVLCFSPLLLIWKRIYGEWTLVPQGSSFMDWANSRWDATLWSSRSGLFAWHPILLIALVGLLVLACQRGKPLQLRLLAGLGVVVLFVQAYINGSARDWWGGWAFGGRRFLGCTIYFMVGLAVVLEGVRRFAVRHPLRVAKLGALGLVALLALYNRSLADDYTFFRAASDQAQPMKPRIAAALTKTLDEAYRYTGNPGSWPVNLWYALRTGGSPETYDLGGAADFSPWPLPRPLPLDEIHAPVGFEPEVEFKGRRARFVRERATWVFSVRVAVDGSGSVPLVGSRKGLRVRMKAGGEWFFDRRVSDVWKDYSFKLPLSATSAGVVVVEVEQALQQPGDFVAWDTPTLRLPDVRPPTEAPEPD